MRRSTQRAVAPLFVQLNRVFGLKDKTARRSAAAKYWQMVADFRTKFGVKRPKLVVWAERELAAATKAHERTTKLTMPPTNLSEAEAVVEAVPGAHMELAAA